MRKVVLLAAALVVALGISASSATSAATETGVTARTVTIGGTFPLTGPASLYAPIPAAMKAYFSYINSRKGPDGKRGVYGRQIVFKYYDDGYNPANSVQLTRKLVEEDKVFALVGTLGTAVNESIRPYVNARKVPQMLVSTGASVFGDAKKYPWTGGWQPAYDYEARIFGQAIAHNSPNAKIAVLYQNDDFGAELLNGLKAGLGAKASNIVDAESHEVTAPDVRAQVAKLRASGASIFVIFTTPKFAIQSYAIANALRWSPAVIYTTSVSATDTFLTLAKSSGGGDLPNKTYTVQYAKDPANPSWDNDAAMKLYKQVMAKYLPSGARYRRPQPLRLRHRRGVRPAALLGREEPDACVADEGVSELEPAEPVPAPGQPAEDGRVGPAAAAVRADHQVHDGTFQPVSKLKCDSRKAT